MSILVRILLSAVVIIIGVATLIYIHKTDNLYDNISDGRKYRHDHCMINLKEYDYVNYIKNADWREKDKGYTLRKPIRVRSYSDNIELVVPAEQVLH